MIDIEPSLDRSTEISILGLALFESPEALQGFGVLSVVKKNKLADGCAKEGYACCFRLLSILWYVVKDT